MNNHQKSKLALSSLFISLNFLDYFTTKKIIERGGKELNPITNFVIKTKKFLYFKYLTTILGLLVIIYDKSKSKKISKSMNFIFILAVLNNLFEIVKYEKGNG